MLSSSLRLEVTLGVQQESPLLLSFLVLRRSLWLSSTVMDICLRFSGGKGLSQGFPLINRAAVKVKLRIGPPSGVPLWSDTLISAVGGGGCLASTTWLLPSASVRAFSGVIGFLFPLY